MRTILALTLAALVAACSSSGPIPPPRPAAPAGVAAVPPPAVRAAPLGVDWRDWPITEGDWRLVREGNATRADFGEPGRAPLLTLRCDTASRRVTLARAGAAATAGSAARMTVRTTSTDRALSPLAGGTPAMLAAELAPRDPLLDAMGFSRGRFVVELSGYAPLVVPAWPEVLRVTEECR